MSSYTVLSTNSSENYQPDDTFEIDDYLSFSEEQQESYSMAPPLHQQNQPQQSITAGYAEKSDEVGNTKNKSMAMDASEGRGFKVAFRTKSNIEIMDDGYKWRKYGKKKIKSSPHLRNYYKCSSDGCKVKKRAEREQDDPRYVITTYEGIHNHDVPLLGACNHHALNSLSNRHSPSDRQYS